MGGVSGLRYLGTYGQDTSLPKIEKFVSIGAPFNDFIDTSQQQTIETELENGPTEKSSRYLDYQEMINVVPEKLPILLIGGQLSLTDLSDGTVPLSSALAVNALLRQRGTQVTSQIIKGENAQHSQLHENPEVDQLLINFYGRVKIAKRHMFHKNGTCAFSILASEIAFSAIINKIIYFRRYWNGILMI